MAFGLDVQELVEEDSSLSFLGLRLNMEVLFIG